MIFKQFEDEDIVAGRTSAVASGLWPGGETSLSASDLVDNWTDLTQSSTTPSPSYGSSYYDVRRTMYYLDVFPSETYRTNSDPYLSVAYGAFGGNLGSGSFGIETSSIMVSPTKAIYTQYKNLLLGTADVDGKFSCKTGSSGATTDANNIYVIAFSSYKMKDKTDEGLLEISLTGSKGCFTYRDDSPFLTQASSVYNLITGSTDDETTTLPAYEGLGLFYPSDGVVVFNADKINDIVGLNNVDGMVGNGVNTCPSNAITGTYQSITWAGTSMDTTVNHKVFFWSLQNSGKLFKVRKTEYVPSRHYFVRVKNRDFNYSNNPTYVYDGSDNVNAAGTIYNEDFINDPKTYITTVGLYNSDNELVAVAKLSRPALKSFDSELLIKVRLDF